MTKISSSTKLKRQMAPAFWQIPRKKKRFALTARSGPHPASNSYPLGMILRDVLRIVGTMQEAKKAVYSGEIKVDGVVRRDIHFPVGLMDVVEISALKRFYRMVPKNGLIVAPIEIPNDEKDLKPCKVISKVTVRGNRLQYGLHDGRTFVDGQKKLGVNDTCILKVPEQKITDTVKLEKGSTALVISGDNAGAVGKVQDIKQGTFILPKRVVLTFKERMVELPVNKVMAVGMEKPLIKVG